MLFEIPDTESSDKKFHTQATIIAESITEISASNNINNENITNFLSLPEKHEIILSSATVTDKLAAINERTSAITCMAQVVSITGNAWISNSSYTRKKISLNSPVSQNDFIETDYNSRLVIRFNDNSELILGENSHIKIEKYAFEERKPENAQIKLKALNGFFRIITGLIVKINPDKFSITTKRATIGIRGCHVAFNVSDIEDNIYVIGISAGKEIIVRAGIKSEELIDASTGEEISNNNIETKTFIISHPDTKIICRAGQEPKQETINQNESLEILNKTTRYPLSKYEIIQKPDGSLIKIIPSDTKQPTQTDK